MPALGTIAGGGIRLLQSRWARVLARRRPWPCFQSADCQRDLAHQRLSWQTHRQVRPTTHKNGKNNNTKNMLTIAVFKTNTPKSSVWPSNGRLKTAIHIKSLWYKTQEFQPMKKEEGTNEQNLDWSHNWLSTSSNYFLPCQNHCRNLGTSIFFFFVHGL